MGVKGLGRKKTDETEHFTWEGDIKVPCGRLIPSEHKDSSLEYNEYAVYDPKQVLNFSEDGNCKLTRKLKRFDLTSCWLLSLFC